MNQVVNVHIAVSEEAARRITGDRQREALGQIVESVVLKRGADPLIALFETIAEERRARGIDDATAEAILKEELEAYNAERRG